MADATERMHFFPRQFLRAADFQDEQAYHLDRRRRHNAGFHGEGVVQGLQVVAGPPDHVTVEPGWGVDALGREIVLATPRGGVPIGGADAEIWISYPDPEPLSRPATEAGVSGFTRVNEEPVVTVVPPGTVPASALRLARVSAGAIDNSVRILAGLKGGAVGEAHLADDVVTSRVLADADPGSDQDPGSGRGVKTAHLKDRAVSEPKLADSAISTRTIARDAVDEARLASNAVSTRTVQDRAITAGKLQSDPATDANRAVGPDHLRNQAVQSRSLAPADAGTDQTLTRGAGIKTGHVTDQAITAAKLATNAVTSDRLQSSPTDSAKRAVGPHHIQDGSVAISQLRSVLVVDQQVSVPAAAGPGQVAEQVVILDQVDGPAFHLVGVHYLGPRLPVIAGGISSFTWTHRTSLVKPPFPPNQPHTHRHELVIQNPNTVAITVACRVYRLLEQ